MESGCSGGTGWRVRPGPDGPEPRQHFYSSLAFGGSNIDALAMLIPLSFFIIWAPPTTTIRSPPPAENFLSPDLWLGRKKMSLMKDFIFSNNLNQTRLRQRRLVSSAISLRLSKLSTHLWIGQSCLNSASYLRLQQQP